MVQKHINFFKKSLYFGVPVKHDGLEPGALASPSRLQHRRVVGCSQAGAGQDELTHETLKRGELVVKTARKKCEGLM